MARSCIHCNRRSPISARLSVATAHRAFCSWRKSCWRSRRTRRGLRFRKRYRGICAVVPVILKSTKLSNWLLRVCVAKNPWRSVAKDFKVIGKPFRKVDARAKCVGQTKFADDIVLPRMLFCKILRSHLPHALIKSVDVSKALALPGVFAVVTGKDFPIPYGILPVSQDEHALCVDKVRFIGDPVAAVAAIDEDVAFDAMNLIEVEYEP